MFFKRAFYETIKPVLPLSDNMSKYCQLEQDKQSEGLVNVLQNGH